MAESFWIRFPIADSGNAERRYQGLLAEIRSSHGQALVDAIATEGKLERYEAIDKVKDEVIGHYAAAHEDGGAEHTTYTL